MKKIIFISTFLVTSLFGAYGKFLLDEHGRKLDYSYLKEVNTGKYDVLVATMERLEEGIHKRLYIQFKSIAPQSVTVVVKRANKPTEESFVMKKIHKDEWFSRVDIPSKCKGSCSFIFKLNGNEEIVLPLKIQ